MKAASILPDPHPNHPRCARCGLDDGCPWASRPRAASIAISAALGLLLAACTTPPPAPPPTSLETLAVRSVDQFQENDGVFRGYRRNHAKGACITGYFLANGAAARWSVAQVFARGERTPFIGRLSIPGTSPYAWDGGTPIRGMALDLTQADGRQWRTAMNAVPAFPVATPQANYRFLQAQQPDPATGNPDPKKLAAFFASHPRANAFRIWDQTTQPSASFATVRYNSLDAFELVDAQRHRHAVRWSMVPEAHSDGAIAPAGQPDYLFADLKRRLAAGPLRWHLVIIFAAPGDAVDDASIPWPADRRQVDAGTLVVTASTPQAHGACRDINFNPLVLPRGIEPSDDPLLQYRADAYAESHRRRVQEHAAAKQATQPARAGTTTR